jgi:hypothetical protein
MMQKLGREMRGENAKACLSSRRAPRMRGIQ